MPRRKAPVEDLQALLERLPQMDLSQLRLEWARRLKVAIPSCRSPDILRSLIAAKLQEQRFGGMSTDGKRRLSRLALAYERDPAHRPPPTPSLLPGTILTREWDEKIYAVQVLESGFELDGRQFGSLSEVARHITGTRWSGPRFFGLKGQGRVA